MEGVPPLGSDPHPEILRCAQSALLRRFGRIEAWPDYQRDPVWVLVQGVIGAQAQGAYGPFRTCSRCP